MRMIQLQGDVPVAIVNGGANGIEVPSWAAEFDEQTIFERLRLDDNGELVDVTTLATTFIDAFGKSFAIEGPGRTQTNAAARLDRLRATLIAEAEARIDAAGDRLAPSPSRTARYQQKATEAVAYVEAGRPGSVSADDYPILVAEAAARSITKSELADAIIARHAGYNALMGKAEALRSTLEAVAAGGTNEAAIRTALDDALAPFVTAIDAAVNAG